MSLGRVATTVSRPRVARLTVYPIKSLDGVDVDAAAITDGGVLADDRALALVDADGNPLTAKRDPRLHEIAASFDLDERTLTATTPGGERASFDLDDGRDAAAAWFSTVLDHDLTLESGEFVDRGGIGPSVLSTATVRTVASWFEWLSPDDVRRRLRANVEVDGVPAFWEDRLVGEEAPTAAVGGVRVEGVTPCGRCAVPEHDPDTGERTAAFRDRLTRRRRETFPEWADEDAFDHYYSVMTIARIPEADRGGTVAVGDPIELRDS